MKAPMNKIAHARTYPIRTSQEVCFRSASHASFRCRIRTTDGHKLWLAGCLRRSQWSVFQLRSVGFAQGFACISVACSSTASNFVISSLSFTIFLRTAVLHSPRMQYEIQKRGIYIWCPVLQLAILEEGILKVADERNKVSLFVIVTLPRGRRGAISHFSVRSETSEYKRQNRAISGSLLEYEGGTENPNSRSKLSPTPISRY